MKLTPEKNHFPETMYHYMSDAGPVPDLSGKRLLILGGSYLQIPAIVEAKRLGLSTAVLDYDDQCPGRALADQFYLQSTIDEEAVLFSARHFKADGIITLGTDWPMRSVAYASEAMQLPAIAYEAAGRSTNKIDMIKQLAKGRIAHPAFLFYNVLEQSLTDIIDHIPLPCIIKPVDASGSRGVVILNHWDDLSDAISYSAAQSKSGHLIIQEFMVGPEVSVEIMILDGQPHVLAITDKLTSGSPYFIETKHTQPSRLSPDQQQQIARLAQDSCRALDLTMGAAHVEIIYTATGPKIVEVGPRMGGDFIATHLVPLSTGSNMTQLVILQAIGLSPRLPETVDRGSCIQYIDRGRGIITGENNLPEILALPGIVQAGIYLLPGSRIGEVRSSADRLGYIIATSETADEADRLADEADRQLIVRLEKQ